MRRSGFSLTLLALLAVPLAAQTPYLDPGEHGVGAAVLLTRTPGSSSSSEPLVGRGVSAVLTPAPRVDLSVQWARVDDNDSTPNDAGSVQLTGYLIHGPKAALGAFGTVSWAEDDRGTKERFNVVGLQLSYRIPAEGRLTVVPQFVTGLVVGGDQAAIALALTPALNLRGDYFDVVVEPSVSAGFGADRATLGVAVGAFRRF